MTRVITYGTYDLLHHGHVKLLERAKALGDYLIVGVTADDFDKTRGKINVTQSLMERVEAVKALGIADEIIIEEYEGQKIDDIRRHNVDIFTVGSDWVGKFDYLNEYCTVVYLPRTEGVSSSELRSVRASLRVGIVGDIDFMVKFILESEYVNGVEIGAICTDDIPRAKKMFGQISLITSDYGELLGQVDAVYIVSHPSRHEEQIAQAFEAGCHVLCESPVAMSREGCRRMFELAKEKNLVLMEGIKTAYSTAYSRLLLMLKSGKIGKVISVDATCTSLKNFEQHKDEELSRVWNTITEWGPPALLPIFQMLGTEYRASHIVSLPLRGQKDFDVFTKVDFLYDDAVASVKIGKNVKSEGELIVSGTKGYAYVPAPWWKTDYFEIRFENPSDNKRYFYQLDGEGIRYEIVAFVKAVETGRGDVYIGREITEAISGVIGDFTDGDKVSYI
ncbi:MAG: glycerol-3-phosphate cytidylyltransferase [Ruminococcaceae bacterium]|nr:glycerol-3-phosphate cytidylyltransferase [Oscillospiraceae bacterium]